MDRAGTVYYSCTDFAFLESESDATPVNWNPDQSPDLEFTLFTELESGKIRLPYSVSTLLGEIFRC